MRHRKAFEFTFFARASATKAFSDMPRRSATNDRFLLSSCAIRNDFIVVAFGFTRLSIVNSDNTTNFYALAKQLKVFTNRLGVPITTGSRPFQPSEMRLPTSQRISKVSRSSAWTTSRRSWSSLFHSRPLRASALSIGARGTILRERVTSLTGMSTWSSRKAAETGGPTRGSVRE